MRAEHLLYGPTEVNKFISTNKLTNIRACSTPNNARWRKRLTPYLYVNGLADKIIIFHINNG